MSAAFVAYTEQVPVPERIVSVLPLTEQVAGVELVYVTAPVPEPPVVPRVWVEP